MNRRQGLGLLVMFVGSLLTLNVLGATIIWDVTPPTLKNPYPAGSSTSPTPLTAGTTITVGIEAYDGTNYLTRTVSCVITKVGDTTFLPVSLTLRPYIPTGVDYAWHQYSWVVPSSSGVTYKFVFSASDGDGNTATKTTYGIVGKPDGNFYVNDQIATPTSTIRVTSAALSLKFAATYLGSQITRVKVIVRSGTTVLKDFDLSETTADTTWTGSFTLPSEGTYGIQGTIYWSGGGGIKMSITTAWGEGDTSISDFITGLAESFGMNQILGPAIIAVGFYIFAKSKEQ